MRNRHTSLRAVIALAIATLISGAAGLSYEIIWTRMLVVPLGNSADAIALVLCSFMLGMAVGARLLGGLADRISSPLKIYVIAEVALGVYAVVMPFVIPALSGSGAPAVVRLVVAAVLVAIHGIGRPLRQRLHQPSEGGHEGIRIPVAPLEQYAGLLIHDPPEIQKVSHADPRHHSTHDRRMPIRYRPETEPFERSLPREAAPHKLASFRQTIAFKMFDADVSH